MSRFTHSFFCVVFFALLVSIYACVRPPGKRRTVREIVSVVEQTLPKNSFEVYTFKVDWYNSWVKSKFDLEFNNDTVALSIQTIPEIFEESFVPFICEKGLSVANDSWPQFIKYYMQKVQRNLLEEFGLEVPDEDILYTNIMLGPGHPLIYVQKSSHVAGAAYYYQREDVIGDPWPKNKTIYGASLHPLYGGWFYMGPVIILRDVISPGLQRKPVKDVLVSDAMKIKFLNLANGNWRTQEWRSVIPVKRKYTPEYLEYSMTYGAQRTTWVTKYYEEHCKNE